MGTVALPGCHSPTQGVPEAGGLQALNSPESVMSLAATWMWWRLPGSRSVRVWDVTSYGPTWGQQGQGQGHAGHSHSRASVYPGGGSTMVGMESLSRE